MPGLAQPHSCSTLQRFSRQIQILLKIQRRGASECPSVRQHFVLTSFSEEQTVRPIPHHAHPADRAPVVHRCKAAVVSGVSAVHGCCLTCRADGRPLHDRGHHRWDPYCPIPPDDDQPSHADQCLQDTKPRNQVRRHDILLRLALRFLSTPAFYCSMDASLFWSFSYLLF